MVLNCMLQLCKITRASKLFQRNFYLPLLKPLSPKDALRKKVITGQNVLGSRIEHYIPVLEEYQSRVQRRKYRIKGMKLVKKRQRRKESMKYVMPFLDEEMEGHHRLREIFARKSRGRGQCYTYYIPDKDITLVIPYQWERAIRDKDITDVVVAQRSDKIVVKLRDGSKISVPYANWDGRSPIYRGEGWTKREVEEYHHHGKETMSIARLFEAKESGLEEWELEMMRLANKRKRKQKGEGTADWKMMMSTMVDNMDWDKFEEETKQIVEEVNQPIDDAPIPMALDDMEKTKNVNEKLKQAGPELMDMLPTMPEIPEVIKLMKDSEVVEKANISGVVVNLESQKERFVPGQVVKSDEGEMFMPGQTLEKEGGGFEFTPGFTVMLEGEPDLLPGLVMGDDPNKPMFLPGESTITETGELQFTETEDDIKVNGTLPPPEPEVEDVEVEEEQNTEDEEEEKRPPPKRERKELVYERPKRLYTSQSKGPKRRERSSKKAAPPNMAPEKKEPAPVKVKRDKAKPKLFELSSVSMEEDILAQEKKRVENFTEKKAKEEIEILKKLRDIRMKVKELKDKKPAVPKYEPLEPVIKSEKLRELEKNIKKGKFFDVDHKKYLSKNSVREPFNWLEKYEYGNVFESVGILRHKLWKSVIYKLFQRNYYLPLLKPLSPKDALRRKIITGQNVLGARIEHYIPVLSTHEDKSSERKRRGKGVPVIKKRVKMKEKERYLEPFFDENMENHNLLQNILRRKPKGKGQYYIYEVIDRNCNVVIPTQMEKAIKDRDIIDVVIAQRSEKIVCKLQDGTKITLPLAPYTGGHPLYRGSGWTKTQIEEEHHHGKETFHMAKLFEAKESGVEEWELEMMRMANKRKKKHRGEDSADWKQMLSGCLDNMDWDKFEEDTKQIVEEQDQEIQEENIPMAVDDMEKTKNVGEKLKQGGQEVLEQLPVMKEIPEVIKNLEQGEMCEIQNVSGITLNLNDGQKRFVAGQMVQGEDENSVFVPGQTIETEEGNFEYTPGITILMDDEPTLIPGLVMGEEENEAMFLPGESAITEGGQLTFEATMEDKVAQEFEHVRRRRRSPTHSPSPPPPPPKPRPKYDEEIVIKRRVIDEPKDTGHKERVRRKAPIVEMTKSKTPPKEVFRPRRVPMEDPLKRLEEERRKREEEEKKRLKNRAEEKMLKAEATIDKLRATIRKKAKELTITAPTSYVPIEPVKKSAKLEELERSIRKGTFFDDDRTKDIIEKAKNQTRLLKYQHVLNSYNQMVNFVLSFCKITGASKIFSRNFYLPLLKPLTPREAFRTFRITGKWLLGSKIQRYIPVLLNHKKKRSKFVKNYGKLKHKEMENYTYLTPILDAENETQKILLSILENKNGNGVFVYTVEDKKLNIVLQANLEYAVRDGDVIDVMVSQKSDKILIKLKDFKKIPVELDYFDVKEPMFCGEGATTEADEKLHHYGKYTMSLAKIFEDKERQEEEWEIMLQKIVKRRRRHAAEKSKEFKALVKENLKKLDWDQFEEDAKRVVQEIAEPNKEEPIDMEIDDLKKTLGVNEFFSESEEMLSLLPKMNDISDVLKNMEKAHLHELVLNDPEGNSVKTISGVKVVLSSGKEVFISGQMVHTEDGEVFVPGQTINTEHGLEFIPGFTVNIDGKPSLINGLIMSQKENEPMFLPTQSAITADGQLTFALTEEERPPPPTEQHIQMRKERRIKLQEPPPEEPSQVLEEETTDEPEQETVEIDESMKESEKEEEAIILFINDNDLFETESSDSDSGISEVDSETYRLKQERDRLELEELKKILMEDGMEKLVTDIEDKKLDLQQRLEELRKLKMEAERPLVSYATEKDACEIASRITQDKEAINRIVDILLTMIRKTSAIRDKNSIHPENIIETHVNLNDGEGSSEKYHRSSKTLKILLKSSVVYANKVFKERPKDQLLALDRIGSIFTDILKNDSTLLMEIIDLMNTPKDRNDICEILFKYLSYDYRDSKVNKLSQIINCPRKGVDKILDGIEKLMEDNNKVMCESFVKLSKIDEDILHDMLEHCRSHSYRVKMENDVINLLEDSMVVATKTFCDDKYREIFEFEQEDLQRFMEQSICFAKALDMHEIADELSTGKTAELRNCEGKTKNFLKRMFLVDKLVNKDFTMRKAVDRLRRNPDQAKHDPRIRQIIKESGVLLSNGFTLSNSRTIPLHLLKSQNLLALEDFLVQRMKISYPVLIIRSDYQAVIPKEALQGVQSGRMPYVLIDESGISNFKPLHSLAALKGGKNADYIPNNNYSKYNGDFDSIMDRRQSVASRTSVN
ncbi:uncharacterized protein LOC123307166 [Coccinella septempunctata]|uniref:uncharacterized protein LOC123307166 n=1 Tax=Coccinella septempunctata TaxID=41139 RepID=UPI001D07E916|nr:uncharacterized protein LOC123307166 [Coccinella septempunctata]